MIDSRARSCFPELLGACSFQLGNSFEDTVSYNSLWMLLVVVCNIEDIVEEKGGNFEKETQKKPKKKKKSQKKNNLVNSNSPIKMDKTLQVQLQIRQNAEEISTALKDIGSWEKRMKQKDRQLQENPSKVLKSLKPRSGGTVPLRSQGSYLSTGKSTKQ